AEIQPHELRQNGRTPAPYPDHFVAARRAGSLCLAQTIAIDKRTFPDCTRHSFCPYCCFFLRSCRLATIKRSVRLFLRVFFPLVGKPHGVTQCLPPLVRPPCGWSTGFMVMPRLCGMRPFQRWRPALPIVVFMLSGLDTAPTVAMQRPCTMRCSVVLRRRMT